MSSFVRSGTGLLLLIAVGCSHPAPPQALITVHVRPGPNDDLSRSCFEVEGLEPTALESIAASPTSGEEIVPYFIVAPDGPHLLEPEHGRPLEGTISVAENTLRFTPRSPLEPGQRYRVVFDLSQLPTKPTVPPGGREKKGTGSEPTLVPQAKSGPGEVPVPFFSRPHGPITAVFQLRPQAKAHDRQ